MNIPDDKIIKLIKKHHVLTLATLSKDELWTSHCFYAYDKDANSLIFLSDKKTKHAQHFIENSKVSGGISLETKIVGKIQGIQLQGFVEEATGDRLKKAKLIYLKRFPFAVFIDTTLWMLNITTLKMTDNNLGFGKKLYWEKK